MIEGLIEGAYGYYGSNVGDVPPSGEDRIDEHVC